MTDAGYVITGWALTGAALGAYWARVVLRTRRAERSTSPPSTPTAREDASR